ncbi:MAG: hypothetical protein H6844_19240 [Alphaproteobacteria bacterium]|nr:hypothetical protein [Alphaproteobacteria bacterium]
MTTQYRGTVCKGRLFEATLAIKPEKPLISYLMPYLTVFATTAVSQHMVSIVASDGEVADSETIDLPGVRQATTDILDGR